MSTAVEHMSRSRVYDANQRIVGGILEIVAVSRCLRESIELRTGDAVAMAPGDVTWSRADGWSPRSIVGTRRGEDLNIAGEVGEHDLSGGQHKEMSDIRGVCQRTRWRAGQREGRTS